MPTNELSVFLSAATKVLVVSYFIVCVTSLVIVLSGTNKKDRELRDYLLKLVFYGPIISLAAVFTTFSIWRALRSGKFDPEKRRRLIEAREEIEKEEIKLFGGPAPQWIERFLKSELFFAYMIAAYTLTTLLFGDPEKILARGS